VPPLKGFPWNLVPALGVKTRMMGLPGRQRSLTISSAIWIQCANVTDGRTDRHRATAKTALTQRRSVKMEVILGQISIVMQAVTGVMTTAILAQL